MVNAKLVAEPFFFFLLLPKHPPLHFPITKKKFCSSQGTFQNQERNFVPQPPYFTTISHMQSPKFLGLESEK